MAKHLKAMLDEGIETERLRQALAEWNRKGLHPSTLPSVVHEVSNRRAPGPRTTRVQEHLTLVQQLAAEEAEAEEQHLRQIGGSR